MMRRTTGRWIAVALAGMVAACAWGITALRDSQDKSKVEKMTQKMMTICVGRFLIDLPEGANVSFATTQVDGVSIDVMKMDNPNAFSKKIEIREQELKETKNEAGHQSLEQRENINLPHLTGVLFKHGRESVYWFEQEKRITAEGMAVEAWVHDNKRQFKLHGSFDNKYLQNVSLLVGKLKSLEKNQIPTEPGFCINQGLISDPLSADQNEMITMFASIKGHPDVAIRLDSQINLKQLQESLLSRNARNIIKREYPSHFKTLRQGARVINGIDGEEVLERVKEENGTSAHAFTWVSLGKMKDVLAPKLTLELDTGYGPPGKQLNSSLSDAAVLELWDRISSSLRLRPTSDNPAQTSEATLPKLPLGELAATGRLCPQTGWWECVDAGNVQGGRRQHFTAGEAMPHAILLGEPSVWQKLKGERPMHQTATVWKLVGHDEEPAVAAATAPEAGAPISESDNQDTLPPQADADGDDAPKAG